MPILHLHTNLSDGTFTPEELVAQALKHELACIALTDHDTVEGCARAAAACGLAGIEFIPGTELTAEQDETEVHLLGYFLDTYNELLLAEIARFQAVRKQRIYEMVARINELGLPLQAEAVLRWPIVNRPADRMWRARWSRSAWCGTWTRLLNAF